MKLDSTAALAPGVARPAAATPGSRWLDALAARAAAYPHEIAIAEIAPSGHVGRSISNSGFLGLSGVRGAALARSLPEGASVLVALPAGIDLASWFVASIGAGVRLVLMHPSCGEGEMRAVAAKTMAAVILTRDSARDAAGVTWDIGDDPARHDPAPRGGAAMIPGRAPGSIVLGSSGTTGFPMLALRESPALDADAAAVASGMGLSPDDTVLCVPPLCHSYGVDILLGSLYSGAALHIMSEFDAAGVAARIASGVSVLPGLPFLYESLLRIDPCDCPRLRLALSAGSDLSGRIREGFGARWGVRIGQLYGATELGTVAIHRPDDDAFDPLSIGPPLPGVSFRILDLEKPGTVLGQDQVGQLAVRAPSMLSGYLGGEVPLIDGHFLTGDLARIDHRGRTTITGRLKFLIDVGGFKVNPLEVEAALREHPLVADCAVVPLTLSDTIRRVRALVVPADPERPPAGPELRGFLKGRLSANKVPRVFEMVPSLPRSPLGKLLRGQLYGGG